MDKLELRRRFNVGRIVISLQVEPGAAHKQRVGIRIFEWRFGRCERRLSKAKQGSRDRGEKTAHGSYCPFQSGFGFLFTNASMPALASSLCRAPAM